jgi:hypothetical protein
MSSATATTATSATASRSASNSGTSSKKGGLDVWLQRVGRTVPVGGQVRVRLVAGPPVHATPDPVDAQAPLASFPCLLKFSSSTVPPNFTAPPWNKCRLYQKDVPPILDDPEEEDASDKKRKRAWRYNRNAVKPRQWILQEHVEFLETMLQQRRKQQRKSGDNVESQPSPEALSSRYEGTPEYTPSQ